MNRANHIPDQATVCVAYGDVIYYLIFDSPNKQILQDVIWQTKRWNM